MKEIYNQNLTNRKMQDLAENQELIEHDMKNTNKHVMDEYNKFNSKQSAHR